MTEARLRWTMIAATLFFLNMICHDGKRGYGDGIAEKKKIKIETNREGM